MNDSNENASNRAIDEQLVAAICTVLHFQIITPPDADYLEDGAAVTEIADSIIKTIQILSKKSKNIVL